MGNRCLILGTASALLFGMLLTGCCKKKPGDSCSSAEPLCLDESNMLVCENGTYISTPCKGPQGCKVADYLLNCDISGNAAGDPCGTSDEGNTACGIDGKTQIACKGGAYQVALCRGPNGCKTEGNVSVCDMSIAEENEECTGMGAANSYACSVDGLKVLRCKGGKFVTSSFCRGKKCEVDGDKVGCPDAIALAGDPCEASSSGGYACAVDGKALLRCSGGKWNVNETCRRKTTCKEKDNTVGCM